MRVETSFGTAENLAFSAFVYRLQPARAAIGARAGPIVE